MAHTRKIWKEKSYVLPAKSFKNYLCIICLNNLKTLAVKVKLQSGRMNVAQSLLFDEHSVLLYFSFNKSEY